MSYLKRNRKQNMKFKHELANRKIFSYQSYRENIEQLLSENKTTGKNHSEAMIGFTSMNVTRMNRLDKRSFLNEDLTNALTNTCKQKWLVISEAWCGDAAQNIPWIAKMAETSNQIDLKIILRDENLDIMDDYLTNGGRSIPKLISLGENDDVLFEWGPRPKNVQSLYFMLKEEGQDYSEISKQLHTWYAKDKGQSLQSEFAQLISATIFNG